MVNPTTVYIRTDTLEWCDAIVESGRFKSFGDMLDYALGFYLDHIERDGVKSVPKIARVQTAKRSARVNPWIVDRLMETGFFEKAELADYALAYYRDWMSAKSETML